ncbi:MAG: hypothetical protein US86_C0005G0007 [Candidatus Daviesbacteria bacterium GW2011_GWA2_38_24]|uniref:Uncharacterized protein n=1 Tax=Candidatus Daviesbacteria bacterium GW2011_GWA2_38_24 TaxID=1618422 RepID=A0A0G0MNB4_9BACT|nr:MAG: hypothetical protein US86_C0005G0007 [Candidatus Daviesbacteria bacterium GW2011_GWA2_38_24]KKQ80054.1 MAG: hypothetical protein UT01_C0021G0005 [Candidatus Daviesbacteria bacterium GW2011_GWA1_38_7]
MKIRGSFLLSKRQKIVTASVLLTFGLMVTQNVNLFLRTRFIIGLTLFAFLVSMWALSEGLSRLKAFTLLLLPTLFTLGATSFYFLLPIRWLTRLPVDIAFGLSIYFLLLSQNVFNVAATRTIPLYRAASTVTFLFTIFTAILLFHCLRVFQLPFYWNGLAVFVITFLLSLPILWSVKMEEINAKLVAYSICISIIITECTIALSFWPIPPVSLMWSIFLSSMLFVLLGLCLDHLKERVTKREVYLYFGFGSFSLLVVYFTTNWSL